MPANNEQVSSFGEAISKCFNLYAAFTGRANRPEYWYFILFTLVVTLLLGFVDALLFDINSVQWLSSLFSLAIFIPSVSVGARRLHDTNRSGWWQLLWMIPLLGWIILVVFLAKKGTDDENRFG